MRNAELVIGYWGDGAWGGRTAPVRLGREGEGPSSGRSGG